ncbi:MAG: type II toxin-antitoxin system VapC family toxin [Actinomycetota bacterium]|nr:type II toxin-antitoxin system VapC family toxin [Actinomycetota bacterium]
MILLDTNVVSEITRREPDRGVLAWLDSLEATVVGTTAVTAAELLYGLHRLPEGQRKAELAAAIHGLLNEDFERRVEPFDAAAAVHHATIVSDREKAGYPISVADAQIAAICRKLKSTLATRNTRDFEGIDIEVVDPWLMP